MVATPPRKRASVAALLLAFLLAAPALPFGPASDASAQPSGSAPSPGLHLQVDQWGVKIGQGTRSDTHFLGNGSFTVSVPILNLGSAYTSQGGSAIPAYAWFEPIIWNDDGTIDTSFASNLTTTTGSFSASSCAKLRVAGSNNIPAATSDIHGVSTPGLTWANFSFPNPPGADGSLRPGGFSLVILVNRAPTQPGQSANPSFAGSPCLAGGTQGYTPQYGVGSRCLGSPVNTCQTGTCASATSSGGADCDGGDNVGFAYFVKDQTWDLTIGEVQFCRGDNDRATSRSDLTVAPTLNCRSAPAPMTNRTDMTYPAGAGYNGALYNSTRRPNDWPCDNATIMRGDLTTLTNEQRQARTLCLGNDDTTIPTNFGDNAPGRAYLAVNLTNNVFAPTEGALATWNDDRDRGNCTRSSDGHYNVDQDDQPDGAGYPLHASTLSYRTGPTVATATQAATQCDQLLIPMGLKLKGPNLPAAGLNLATGRLAKGWTTWWPSDFLNLSGIQGSYGPLAGEYSVEARIDPEGAIPQAARANDYQNITFEVAWTDLSTHIDTSLLKTSPSDAYTYPAKGPFNIPVSVEFRNDGPARPSKFLTGSSPTERRVNWSIWLDDLRVVFSGTCETGSTCAPVGANDSAGNTYRFWINKTFLATSDPDVDPDAPAKYLTPGEHIVHACIDCDPLNQTSYWSGNNRTFEINEANNAQDVKVYVQNVGLPVVQPTWGGLSPRLSFNTSYDDAQASCVSSTGGCPFSAIRPREDVNVTLNVSDADQDHLNVSFVFQLSTNASVTRSYYPCPPGSGASTTQNCVYHREDSTRYYAWITNFGFANATVRNETWTLVGNATNSGNHSVTSSATTFRLTRWPLQTARESDVVYGLRNLSAEQAQGSNAAIFDPDNGNYSYATDSRYPYWLYVSEDMTGIKGQPNITTNLGMRVDFPRNETRYYNGTTANYWTPQRHCTPVNPGGLPVDPTGSRDTTLACTDLGNFSSLGIESLRNEPGDVTGAGLPGRWNITLFVTDKGGDVRSFNRTVFWIKSPPQLSNATFSSHAIDPGQPFSVHLNVSDEFGAASAFVNFSRAQPTPYNVSFALHDPVNGAPGRLVNVTFNNTIQTGVDSMFGVAGNFSAWFSAVDEFGNWANTTPEQFLVNDTEKPNLLVATVDHPRQEVGLPVVFTLNATDATNMTAYLQVLRGSETIIPNATVNDTKMPMTRVSSGNFTYEAEFATEGSYVWNMWVEDSVGQRSDLRTGPLSISANLGPRFDLATEIQRNTIEGQIYTRAQPTIQFTVYDFDGVSKETIHVKINEREVAPDSIEPTTGDLAGKGWVVTYAVPSTQRFHHLDVVHVNLTAIDLSEDTLPEWDNFTLVVDDVPPVVRLLDFAPRFRSEDRNIWNVSLQTQFGLVADDNDNLPTGVDRIQYSIIGGGNNAATNLYSGSPFTIGGAPGIYTGPRVYQIQFWAVDSVGNENHTHDSITVYVDDLPPSLDPFGSLPQGRFINASFIDDRSGVDRAVVWTSTNGVPYDRTPLDFNAGIWSTVLPECRKGDVIAYYLQAWDRVNNSDTFGNASVPYSRYTCGNHVPEIKVTAPAEGSVLTRAAVDLAWTASDGDNDALSFTVFYRAPGKSQFVELAKVAGNARKYTLDLTQFKDGQYTFRVTVSDGTFVALSETTITILTRGSAIGPVGQVPGDVPPGNSVLLTVQITKAPATVEAQVFRDGKFVASYPMNDDGRDGDVVANDDTYSRRVAFDQAGDYTVDFAVHYQEDGQTKDQTFQDQVRFSVKLTPDAIFQQYGVFLVLVGLLAIAGIGVAAFVLLRRR